MASPLTAVTITAISQIAVATTDGVVQQPVVANSDKGSFTAWSESIAPNIPDDALGSRQPVALKILEHATKTYPLRLTVKGTCLFPSTYPRQASCRLEGTFSNAPNGNPSIVSEIWPVTLKTGNPWPPDSKDFEFKDLTMELPFSTLPCPTPFRLAGDCEWQIVKVDEPAAPPLKYSTQTRLEFVWLLGPPMEAVHTVPGSFQHTGPSFNGAYPIGLLRLFLPSVTEFINNPDLIKSYEQWWIQQAAKRIPEQWFRYDTIAGKAGYNLGCCGGNFALDEFVHQALSDTRSPDPMLINSFDLAGLMQLASSLLITEGSEEKLYSYWICKYPYGKPTAGLPFGFTSTTQPDITSVNNPYFTGIDGAKPFELNDTDIVPSNMRCWIEPTFPDPKVTVVDLAWKSPEFALGTTSRKEYLKAYMADVYQDKDSASYLESAPLSKGRILPQSPLARVGVYGIGGLLQPRPDFLFLPVPPTLKLEINALIQSGQSTNVQGWGYNNASLRTETIKPLVTTNNQLQLVERYNIKRTRLRVVAGAARTSYLFQNLPIGQTVGQLSLNILVCEKLNDAFAAMTFELTKYERDLSQPGLITPLPTIGNYALQTPRSVLCLRGNLFIEMTIHSTSKPDKGAFDVAVGAMTRLDNYLAPRLVSRSQLRRPSLALATLPPASVKDELAFIVTPKHPFYLAETITPFIDRGSLIAPGTYDVTTRSQGFWVLKRPDSKAHQVHITLAAAHAETFHPASFSFVVEVRE